MKEAAQPKASAPSATNASNEFHASLDEVEFTEACTAMGFAKELIPDIFTSLDKDGSGEIDTAELLATLAQEGCSDLSLDAKRLLITLAWCKAPKDYTKVSATILHLLVVTLGVAIRS